MNVNEAQVLTSSFSNEVFVIPQGARTIDINNTGGSNITFLGNSNSGSLILSPVAIATSQGYSFGDIGKPYPSITVDCIGSSCDINVNY